MKLFIEKEVKRPSNTALHGYVGIESTGRPPPTHRGGHAWGREQVPLHTGCGSPVTTEKTVAVSSAILKGNSDRESKKQWPAVLYTGWWDFPCEIAPVEITQHKPGAKKTLGICVRGVVVRERGA